MMSLKIVHTVCFVLLCCCLPKISSASSPDEDDTYITKNRLFYIERSKNRNIVCYDLNQTTTGEPNEKTPLSVYWINREEHPGQQGTLSYIQQKMAFGYTVVEKRNGTITVELNAVKNRKITIEQNGREYFCQTEINKQPSTLLKIYVKTKANNSLQVEYVDIQGLNLATGTPVSERITP